MVKVGICGHFGEGKNLLNGQTVKTKVMTKELIRYFGQSEVVSLDTHNWNYNPLRLLIGCLRLIKNCGNIIILPAIRGVKVFVPLFLILNKFFNRKLHYVVIGGWLPEVIRDNPKLLRQLIKFDGVYVETHSMIEALNSLGLNNVYYLPNFKPLNIVSVNELVYLWDKPLKLCTFSRVMKEKGIEDAIDVVKTINAEFNQEVYKLDIYGQVDENYCERFNEIRKSFPDFIEYKGYVEYYNSCNVLKDYFLLLFPTQFKTEGIPGTIIDAYASGLPVLSSNWYSAAEIIDEKRTGFIYGFMQNQELKEQLISIAKNPNIINSMRISCIKKAKSYMPQQVIEEFIRYL